MADPDTIAAMKQQAMMIIARRGAAVGNGTSAEVAQSVIELVLEQAAIEADKWTYGHEACKAIRAMKGTP